MKSKMREKVRPKLGKIDIDYQKLHDAFFKWQTKPRLTTHGDLYYEGKEFEIRYDGEAFIAFFDSLKNLFIFILIGSKRKSQVTYQTILGLLLVCLSAPILTRFLPHG